jgi:GTP-binding protein HflX
VVALVGYTNAGKSTLFNRMTGADVMAMDKLFATLDPTLRHVKLPSGIDIMLSDTVGFISDLPHELVAAFRATLEEVQEADLLLHVRDISHPDSTEQKEDVLQVLRGLLDEHTLTNNLIEVWNKIDKLENVPGNGGIAVSALTGAGIDTLLARLSDLFNDKLTVTLDLTLPASDGKSAAWLYQHGTVLSQTEQDGELHMKVRLTQENVARWEKMVNA